MAENDGIALAPRNRLNAGDELAVQVVLNARHQQRYGIRAAKVQAARKPVRGIIVLPHDCKHALARFRKHLLRVVQGARYRGNGNTSRFGNFLDIQTILRSAGVCSVLFRIRRPAAHGGYHGPGFCAALCSVSGTGEPLLVLHACFCRQADALYGDPALP